MCVCCVCVVQGGERARKSPFQKTDNLMEFFYDDAKTLYQIFQRGKRESGECVSVGVVSVGVNICVIHVQLMVPVLVGERELISNTNG